MGRSAVATMKEHGCVRELPRGPPLLWRVMKHEGVMQRGCLKPSALQGFLWLWFLSATVSYSQMRPSVCLLPLKTTSGDDHVLT